MNNSALLNANSKKTLPSKFSINILAIVLLFFIAITAIQAIQLRYLLSDAKSADKNIVELRTERESILNDYLDDGIQ